MALLFIDLPFALIGHRACGSVGGDCELVIWAGGGAIMYLVGGAMLGHLFDRAVRKPAAV